MVEALCRRTRQSSQSELPETLFRLYTDLIDAEVGENLARELVEGMRHSATAGDDPVLLKAHVAQIIEDQIQVAGPLRLTPGQAHVVALVGPTASARPPPSPNWRPITACATNARSG